MHVVALAVGIALATWTAILTIRFPVDLAARLRVLERALKARPLALAIEGIYVITDPALRPLRRHVPPLRLGSISVDLSYVLLLVLLSIVGAGLDRF